MAGLEDSGEAETLGGPGWERECGCSEDKLFKLGPGVGLVVLEELWDPYASPGPAGYSKSRQGDPQPLRVSTSRLAHGVRPALCREMVYLQEPGDQPPAFLLPPPPQKLTTKSGKKSKLFIYTSVCTLVPEGARLRLESLLLLGWKQGGGESSGPWFTALGLTPLSPPWGLEAEASPEPEGRELNPLPGGGSWG